VDHAHADASQPPISGWTQPDVQGGPPTGVRRVLAGFVWLAATLLLVLAGWIGAIGREASSAGRIGYVAGTIAAALGIATLARWVWLRIRRHEPGERRLVSVWIPVVSVFFAVGLLGTAIADAVPPPPMDPATLFHIGPGYTLTDTDPGIEKDVRAEFDALDTPPRALAITSIEADDGSIGALLVLDMSVMEVTSDLTLEGMMKGVNDQAKPRREVVAGRSTMFATADGISFVGWVDAPLIALVYGPDDPTARAMAESVIVANEGNAP
jgi:hypothetical protein